jgi:hypothetical protein
MTEASPVKADITEVSVAEMPPLREYIASTGRVAKIWVDTSAVYGSKEGCHSLFECEPTFFAPGYWPTQEDLAKMIEGGFARIFGLSEEAKAVVVAFEQILPPYAVSFKYQLKIPKNWMAMDVLGLAPQGGKKLYGNVIVLPKKGRPEWVKTDDDDDDDDDFYEEEMASGLTSELERRAS